MAEARHPDAAAEIEDIASIDGMQVGALGGLDHEVRVAVVRGRYQLRVSLPPGRRVCGAALRSRAGGGGSGPGGD